MRRLDTRGDTIVEVILAMAVVGLILGSSYSIANRSLLSARRAQERSEALKITEGQVEKIKTLASQDFPSLQNTVNIYCLSDDLSVNSMAVNDIPDYNAPNFAAYPAQCINGLYYTAVKYSGNSGPSRDTFTVSTQWVRAGGGGQDEVRLIYKVHQP